MPQFRECHQIDYTFLRGGVGIANFSKFFFGEKISNAIHHYRAFCPQATSLRKEIELVWRLLSEDGSDGAIRVYRVRCTTQQKRSESIRQRPPERVVGNCFPSLVGKS